MQLDQFCPLPVAQPLKCPTAVDWFLNNAARRRPHDGVLRAWYDCVHAVSVSRPVMGDAEKPELTKQFNEGYKPDLAEPGEAPGGKDEISEVKLWTPLRGCLRWRCGRPQ